MSTFIESINRIVKLMVDDQEIDWRFESIVRQIFDQVSLDESLRCRVSLDPDNDVVVALTHNDQTLSAIITLEYATFIVQRGRRLDYVESDLSHADFPKALQEGLNKFIQNVQGD